jgi:hypothetical protein
MLQLQSLFFNPRCLGEEQDDDGVDVNGFGVGDIVVVGVGVVAVLKMLLCWMLQDCIYYYYYYYYCCYLM